jgi:two-component system chemotaxis sensor kinase CheA
LDTSQYKDLFVSESKEILANLNRRLVDFEKQPEDKDCLNDIFRQAHTLKGMAAAMGYDLITKLTHEMESVLDLLRKGIIKADKTIADLLFSSFDALEGLVEEVVAKDGQSLKAKKTDLALLISEFEKVKAALGNRRELLQKEKRTNLRLDTVDRREIIEKEIQGFRTYRLVISLSKDCISKEARSFVVVRALEEFGKVIRREFLHKQLESGKYGRHFGVFFITKEDIDLVKIKIEAISDVEKVIFKLLEADEVLLSQAKPGSRPAIIHNEEIKDKGEASRPLHMVKVPMNKLDDLMDEVGELVINKTRLANIARDLENKPLEESLAQMDQLTDELQVRIMDIRLVPMEYIFNRFPRLVRDVAAQEKKEVDIIIEGSDIGLDRAILEEINESLVHLLKNAVSHGIELPEERQRLGKSSFGQIVLSARRDKAYVMIEVSDDGQGIDAVQVRRTAIEAGLISKEEVERLSDEESLMLIALPGFSTSKVVTEASGRGVGMYSAKTKISSFGGDLTIKSKINEGSRFILKLPLSMAIVQALLVSVGTETYAVPLVNITETIKIKSEIIKFVEHHEVIPYREEILPLVRLKERFGFSAGEPGEIAKALSVVVVEVGRRKAGLVVDRLLGQQEVVIKALSEPLKSMKGLAGATILGDGKVAAIVDVASII